MYFYILLLFLPSCALLSSRRCSWSSTVILSWGKLQPASSARQGLKRVPAAKRCIDSVPCIYNLCLQARFLPDNLCIFVWQLARKCANLCYACEPDKLLKTQILLQPTQRPRTPIDETRRQICSICSLRKKPSSSLLVVHMLLNLHKEDNRPSERTGKQYTARTKLTRRQTPHWTGRSPWQTAARAGSNRKKDVLGFHTSSKRDPLAHCLEISAHFQ